MIEFDIGLRGSGKTHRLIEWVNESPDRRRLIVPTSQQAKLLLTTRDMTKGTIMPFDALRGGALRASHRYEVAIDNLDQIIGAFFGSGCDLQHIAAFGCLSDDTLAALDG